MKNESWKRKMKDKLTVQIHGGKGGNKPSIDYSKKKKKKKRQPIKDKKGEKYEKLMMWQSKDGL